MLLPIQSRSSGHLHVFDDLNIPTTHEDVNC